ncbi:MAG: hypothetical protein HY894_02235 [Deltaproteobacteria bacterium]|nr:hypothetical protein [Deltaproteobacteria bacterium]
MKRTTAAMAATAIIFTALSAARAETAAREARPGNDPGRYQVLSAEYEAAGGPRGLYNKKIIIKLDTVTGKTWVLKEIVEGKTIEESGTTIRYWVEMEDYRPERQTVIKQGK